MRTTLATLLALLAAIALSSAAIGAEMSDEDYVTKAFGCTAVFVTANQLVDPNSGGWWGDKLPPELNSNSGYLIGVVNAQRMSKNIKPLLDPNEYLISVGYEEQTASGWTYFIDFSGMRKSEVLAILELLGGPGKVLPGSELSFRPLSTRSFYSSAVNGTVTLALAGQQVSFSVSAPVSEIRQKVAAAFRSGFGADVPFDLYVSQYSYNNGTIGGDVSVYADTTGNSLAMSGDYGGEGGM
jgi:hypothetical protein